MTFICEPTDADRADVPASYVIEDRYLGYRDADRAKPYASDFSEDVLPVQRPETPSTPP